MRQNYPKLYGGIFIESIQTFFLGSKQSLFLDQNRQAHSFDVSSHGQRLQRGLKFL